MFEEATDRPGHVVYGGVEVAFIDHPAERGQRASNEAMWVVGVAGECKQVQQTAVLLVELLGQAETRSAR
ncbi:hypothetical protein [Nocardia arizonensis]|uniref:hypothetical protein n=1 Tax=Nocardia arizonensis TaxID=1141647 RepID=UPI0006D03528|nr:hypothetical protein [Nocardia arizonensis]